MGIVSSRQEAANLAVQIALKGEGSLSDEQKRHLVELGKAKAARLTFSAEITADLGIAGVRRRVATIIRETVAEIC